MAIFDKSSVQSKSINNHIDHGILLNKLKTFDIPDFMLKWFHAFLSDHKQKVCMQEHSSDCPRGPGLDWVRVNG